MYEIILDSKKKKKKQLKTFRRKLFECEEEGYYKPVIIGSFCSNKNIEYESKGDRNKTLSVEKLDHT